MHLTDFTNGDRMRLLDFGHTPLQYRRRLLALGITRGTIVEITRTAPLGCPVQVQVRDTALALRKEDVRFLIWERV